MTVTPIEQRPLEGIDQLDWFEFRREPGPANAGALADLERELAVNPAAAFPPGSRVGIAVGSRGVARIGELAALLVAHARRCGAEPVVIPAMGSHGGATSAGQVKVLHELGVDESSVGAPVAASMEADEIGHLTTGQAVFTSRVALGCDQICLVNRVKPHTEFRARRESGLTKMLTIGLGKERGASSLHRAGLECFDQVLPEAAAIVLSRLPVRFGVAVLEDAWHRLRRAELVPGADILEREQALLSEAWSHFGRLPFPEVDLLLLKEMGKTISGTGMDPNVTGRFPSRDIGAGTKVERLVVLDLAPTSGGNAVGVGLADIVTERLRAKVDWPTTYANVIASKSLPTGKLPLVMGSDRAAVELGLSSLTGAHSHEPKLVALTNTLEVNHCVVSAPLAAAASDSGYQRVGGPARAEFGPDGSLWRVGGLEFFGPGR